MPRPQPLTNVSGRAAPSDGQSLTPRTPHSRAGREAETFAEIELDNDDDHDSNDRSTVRQQQSEPLLASSVSSGFPRTSRRLHDDDPHDVNQHMVKAFNDWRRGLDVPTVLSRIPVVVGAMVAGFLLFLVIVSVRSPDTLKSYIQEDSKHEAIPSAVSEAAVDEVTITNPAIDADLIISYDQYTNFPLTPTEFSEQCEEMLSDGKMLKEKYWEIPAEGIEDVLHQDEINPPLPLDQHATPICKSSVTYMLSGEIGLFADLALMVQVAALARERNRTFFVDDTYWDRGRWSDYFQDVTIRQPGPQPGCKRPPPDELVACPRHARHWVVSSTTAQYHLGTPFMHHYENAYGKNLNRMKPIFDFAYESLHNTIRPNAEVNNLIRSARTEFRKQLLSKVSRPTKQHDNDHFNETIPRYLGVHVRRGDKHGAAWNYHDSYVPIEEFAKAAQETWTRLAPPPSPFDAQPQPAVYFASDDPTAQNYFTDGTSLSTVFSLMESSNQDLNDIASPNEYWQGDFDDLEKDARIRATKGVIVDFALMTGVWAKKGDIVPDAIICGISSAICKMAVPALGWERAFGQIDKMGRLNKKLKRWVEVDEKGSTVPVWKPFDLFL